MFCKISSPTNFGSIDGHFNVSLKFDQVLRPQKRIVHCTKKLHKLLCAKEKTTLVILILEALLVKSGSFTSFHLFILLFLTIFKKTGNYCLVLSSLLFKTGIGCINKRVVVDVKSLINKQHPWGDIAVFGSLQPPLFLEERTELMHLGPNTLATIERDWLWIV